MHCQRTELVICFPGAQGKDVNGELCNPDLQGMSEDELLGIGNGAIPLAMDYNTIQHSYKPER